MTSTCVNEDEQAAVSGDVPCVGCEYNLRTLSTTGACPECGHPVADSLRFFHEDSLWLANPRWIRRLQMGTTQMLVAAVGAVVILVLFICSISLLRGMKLAEFVVLPLCLAMAGLWCWAVFIVTGAEPARRRGSGRRLPRWFARSCAVIQMIPWSMIAGLWVLQELSYLPRGWSYPLWLYVIIIFLSMYILPFLCPLTVGWYCRRFGARGQRPGLTRLNTALMVLSGLGLMTFAAGVVVLYGFGLSAHQNVWPLGMLATFVGILLVGGWSCVGHRRMLGAILAMHSS